MDRLWATFAILILLDLLLLAVRTSVANARTAQLVIQRQSNPAAVDRAIEVLSRPRLRISLRLALFFVHVLLAGVFWQILVEYRVYLGYRFAGLLAFGAALLLVEYALEGRVLLNPERVAARFSGVAAGLDTLFMPLSSVAAVLLGIGPNARSLSSVTEDELRTWVEEGQAEGSLEKEERKMIYSIFQFRETLAREIMIPRLDLVTLDIQAPLAEALRVFSSSGFSRVPVYEEDVDNIIGLLYAKDLLGIRRDENEPLANLRELLRPVYYVPETKKVDELLTEMQASRVHVSIVVDEYGGVAGLVTLEDILEEIIGEIQDEYDQAEEMLYQQIGPDEYIFLGRIDLDDFNEVMNTHLVKGSADTLGGYLYQEIGRVPTGGETIVTNGVSLQVEQVTGRRIRKVRARRNDESAGGAKPTGVESMEVDLNDTRP